MWYLLLVVPAIVLVMGFAAKRGPITVQDRAFAAVDVRLNLERQIRRDQVAAHAAIREVFMPQRRRVPGIAPRPVSGQSKLVTG